MYDLQADKSEPFVPRDLRLEVTERVRHDGRVEIPLDLDEVRAAVQELKRHGVESIAVCLLYSYVRPEHEQEIGRIISEEFPEAYVSLSSEVLPEFREFERLSTVVTNAYVGPVVARYLALLRRNLADAGLKCLPHVTQSNGGIIPFPTAEELPVRLVLSGPSTGVVGAAAITSAAGSPDIITFDMGGTSSDVSLVQNGTPKVTSSMELDGRPIRSPCSTSTRSAPAADRSLGLTAATICGWDLQAPARIRAPRVTAMGWKQQSQTQTSCSRS